MSREQINYENALELAEHNPACRRVSQSSKNSEPKLSILWWLGVLEVIFRIRIFSLNAIVKAG